MIICTYSLVPKVYLECLFPKPNQVPSGPVPNETATVQQHKPNVWKGFVAGELFVSNTAASSYLVPRCQMPRGVSEVAKFDGNMLISPFCHTTTIPLCFEQEKSSHIIMLESLSP